MGQAGRVADSRLRPLVFFPTSLALCRGSHRGPGDQNCVHNCARTCSISPMVCTTVRNIAPTYVPHACAQMHTIACATAHKTAPPAKWVCTAVHNCRHNCVHTCPSPPMLVHKCTHLNAQLCAILPHLSHDCAQVHTIACATAHKSGPTRPMVVRRCQSCEPNDSDNDDADGDGGDDDDTRTPRTIKPYFDNVDLSPGESQATAA